MSVISLETLREILSGAKTEHKNSLEASSVINEVWKEVLEYSEPVRKTGKWVQKHFVWFCSECGENPTKGMGYVQGHDELYDFCPNCGSYNGGEQDDSV